MSYWSWLERTLRLDKIRKWKNRLSKDTRRKIEGAAYLTIGFTNVLSAILYVKQGDCRFIPLHIITAFFLMTYGYYKLVEEGKERLLND